jgi:hypothetical protein
MAAPLGAGRTLRTYIGKGAPAGESYRVDNQGANVDMTMAYVGTRSLVPVTAPMRSPAPGCSRLNPLLFADAKRVRPARTRCGNSRMAADQRDAAAAKPVNPFDP